MIEIPSIINGLEVVMEMMVVVSFEVELENQRAVESERGLCGRMISGV